MTTRSFLVLSGNKSRCLSGMKVFINGWSLTIPEMSESHGFFSIWFTLSTTSQYPHLYACFQCLCSYICLVFLTSLKLKWSLNKTSLYITWNHCITSSLLPYHKTYITMLFTQSHIQQIVLSFRYAQGAVNKASLVSHFRENTDMSSSYAIHYMTTVVTSIIEVPRCYETI